VKLCGFNEVVRSLVNDMIILADKGVCVDHDGQSVTYKPTLVAVVADSLAGLMAINHACVFVL